jgi:hypothetical protein
VYKYPFQTSSSSSTTIALAYTDPPGSYGSRTVLINSLTLTVVDSSGAVVAAGTSTVDNVQKIVFTNTTSSVFTVLVSGTVSYTQPFALVIAGGVVSAGDNSRNRGVRDRIRDQASRGQAKIAAELSYLYTSTDGIVVLVVCIIVFVCLSSVLCRVCMLAACCTALVCE